MVSDPNRFDLVTTRQLDVWKKIAQGKENKIIAYELGMAEATVKIHTRALMTRLKLNNRTQLALDYYPIDWRGEQIGL